MDQHLPVLLDYISAEVHESVQDSVFDQIHILVCFDMHKAMMAQMSHQLLVHIRHNVMTEFHTSVTYPIFEKTISYEYSRALQ